MDDTRKTAKSDKPNSAAEREKSGNNPDTDGLTASLEALKPVTSEGDSEMAGDVVELSSRSPVNDPAHQRSLTKETSCPAGDAEILLDKIVEQEEAEPLGVVELLGALKSDIDSLRQENEEFKSRLISAPVRHGNPSLEAGDARSEMHALLEALKADIGNLREENDLLRRQAFAPQDNIPASDNADEELYGMLVELKDDIVSLRTENDALREGDGGQPFVRSAQKSDDVAMVLRELKSDIDVLKHDNQSLRLENLTARDGAHFENLGGQQEAYRHAERSIAPGLLKGVAALALVTMAAGGGYYVAKMQGGENVLAKRSIAAPGSNKSQGTTQRSAKLAPRTVTVAPTVKPVEASVKVQSAKAPPTPTPAPRAKITVSPEAETAMMARASGYMEARDIGSARMVFVYLAGHGSAVAMTRLAQTYDPQFLGLQGFDEAKNGDLVRAKRLYSAAFGMGDTQAAMRLQEMQ